MSCGTCPDSAQPTNRSDGTAPTPGQLLWSKDVGAWYRRQRERGERPAITMPVALSKPEPQADPPSNREKLNQAIGRLLDLGTADLCDGGIHGGSSRLIGFDRPLREKIAQADEVVACSRAQKPSADQPTAAALVFREGTYVTSLTVDLDGGQVRHRERRCRSEVAAKATVESWSMPHGRLFYCVRCRSAFYFRLSPNGVCTTCQGTT